MISKTTLKEYKSIKNKQANGFHQYLIFMIDKQPYKCTTLGPAGLKEILTFRTELKKAKMARIQLLNLQEMLQ